MLFDLINKSTISKERGSWDFSGIRSWAPLQSQVRYNFVSSSVDTGTAYCIKEKIKHRILISPHSIFMTKNFPKNRRDIQFFLFFKDLRRLDWTTSRFFNVLSDRKGNHFSDFLVCESFRNDWPINKSIFDKNLETNVNKYFKRQFTTRN